MSSPSSHVDLLIVGAGPAGLTAACWAAQYNISTRIIDKKKKRTETGHADGIQSRTLEILQSFGIVDPILKQGIRDVDMSHWVSFEKPKGKFHIDNAELIFQAINHETDRIERCGRYEADSGKHSRFGQILLNQGVVEQVFADHLEKKNIYVERGREAESLHISTNAGHDTNQYAVSVGVKNGDSNEKRETIHARYLIACDGAHSWVRSQFNVSSDAVSEDSTWGVLDIIPITDFPDIRNSCSIDSQPHGSVMTVPRENRLVRFYIQIRDESKEKEAVQHHTRSPQAMIETAEKLMKPYKLTYKYCDWWSNYSIGRRLAKTYRPYERVFLTGDAAHTHSPKGGQGMNVSIQDSYNLLWKVGAVLTNCANPTILETYEAERRPVAKQLMDLDSRLVEAYEKNQSDVSSGIYEIREQYAGFMSGTDVSYAHSILTAQDGQHCDPSLAKNLRLGTRLPSVLIVYQCDGIPVHIADRMPSDGSWRLLVFPGDLRQSERMTSLACFADSFSQCIRGLPGCGSFIELLLIQSSPRNAGNLLDLPELFHPFDSVKGWDYWKVFADDKKQAYSGYSVDEGGPGCLVLCRPDQHIAWIGRMDDMTGLERFLSVVL